MGNCGLLSLLHLAALIYAAIQIFNSSADITKKVISGPLDKFGHSQSPSQGADPGEVVPA